MPVQQPQTVEEVKKLCEEKGIEFVFASFTEIKGKSNAKLVPAEHIEDLFAEGAGAAGFAAGDIGQGPHSPDVVTLPDPKTFRVVPWKKNLGHVIGNVYVNGEPWAFCPRTILQRQVDRAREMGFDFRLGFEAEFMLVDFDEDGKLQVADEYDNWSRPCYDVKSLSRNYEFATRLSKYVTELGWENYAVDHEDGNGQFECNVTYADAVESADRAVFFRYMVDMLAREHGSLATFMPKPFTDNTGNGMHFTMSLWDMEKNINLFEAAEGEEDPRGFGLSDIAYHFVAGLLEHARGYAAMAAPTVNSYKRLKPGTENVRTWVPVARTWGGNNRTQMVRIARNGAIEDRTPDFSGSPYLAMAAALAAGLDGIERKLDPGPINEKNLYDFSPSQLQDMGIKLLPGSLWEACHYLGKDDVLRKAFGKVPKDNPDGSPSDKTEDFVDYYIRVKNDEFHEVTDEVSPIEIERYLLYP